MHELFEISAKAQSFHFGFYQEGEFATRAEFYKRHAQLVAFGKERGFIPNDWSWRTHKSEKSVTREDISKPFQSAGYYAVPAALRSSQSVPVGPGSR